MVTRTTRTRAKPEPKPVTAEDLATALRPFAEFGAYLDAAANARLIKRLSNCDPIVSASAGASSDHIWMEDLRKAMTALLDWDRQNPKVEG